MKILKTGVVVVAALFSFTCLFAGTAVAKHTARATEEMTGNEIQAKKAEKQARAKKKRGVKKEKAVIGGSLEQRKAALQASFRRAGISPEEIDELFSDERIEIHYNIYSPALKEGEPKKKKLSYFDDEFGLLKPESIESGKRIMTENKELFERLESLYGIPANYIVAIIRVETNFKEHLGQYRVFNALYTMAMLSKRPKRVNMAGKELVAWLKMCKKTDTDPFAVKGSWAGAFGIPQFMPSSYVIFAVDDNNDGIVDLYDYPDAFASIANYLCRVGWKTGNEKRMRQAVYRYNHEKAYVNAVFAYAQTVGANTGSTAYPGVAAYSEDTAYAGDTAYPGDIPLDSPTH